MSYDKKKFADYQKRRLAGAYMPKVQREFSDPWRQLSAAIVGLAVRDYKYALKHNADCGSPEAKQAGCDSLLSDTVVYFLSREFENHCAICDINPAVIRRKLGVTRDLLT